MEKNTEFDLSDINHNVIMKHDRGGPKNHITPKKWTIIPPSGKKRHMSGC